MPGFFARHSDTIVTIATIVLAFLGLVTIVDQRFNAQNELIDQRFNAQNELIDQRFNAQNELTDQRLNAQNELIDLRFDAQGRRIDDLKAGMNQRFDAQDKRLDRLTDEVFELRKLTVGIIERVSRNEGEIDVIREQLQTADKPPPLD